MIVLFDGQFSEFREKIKPMIEFVKEERVPVYVFPEDKILFAFRGDKYCIVAFDEVHKITSGPVFSIEPEDFLELEKISDAKITVAVDTIRRLLIITLTDGVTKALDISLLPEEDARYVICVFNRIIDPDYKEIVEKLIEEFERVKDRPLEEIFYIWMIAQALNEEFNEKAKELEEKYKRGEITADEYVEAYRLMREAENLKGRIIEEFGKRFRPMPIDYWKELIEKNLRKIVSPYREIVEKYKEKLLERLPVRPETIGARIYREIEERFGKSVADALAEAMDDIVRRMRELQREIVESPETLTVDDIYNMLISEFERAVRDELVKRYIPPIIADQVAKFLVERTRERWRELAEDLAGIRVERRKRIVRPVERWETAPPTVTVPAVPEEYEKFPVLVGNPMLWQMFIREYNAVADLLSALEKESAIVEVLERDELGRPIVAVLRDKWHKEFLDLPFIVYADWYAIGVATGAIPRSWAETTMISPYEQFKRYGETIKTRLIRYRVLSEGEAKKPLVPEPERSKILDYLRRHGIRNPELLF